MRVLRRTAIVLTVVSALAGMVAGAWVWRATQPFAAYAGGEQFVDLLPGDGTAAITRKLVAAGVVSDRWTFRFALWRSGLARRLKAGEYRFDRPMRAEDVVSKLARGEVYLRPVTFPEGLTVREMARVFEARGLGTAASFVEAARDDTALVSDIDPTARSLEGYLFPETYALSRHAGAAELVGMMVGRFHQVFTPELRDAAAARGLTPREAVTLASMVEKETARDDERPVIAGVYLHRLRLNMALQCDPTVIYALETLDRYHGNLTRENLRVDSPYNTYRYPGLPPGPIGAPSRASLEAVAHAAPVDYLYFVSRNDGTHVFARTLEEQNRNVRKYQVEFFRLKRLQAPHH
jgi:peptidoglycan lytic transglycosylase G